MQSDKFVTSTAEARRIISEYLLFEYEFDNICFDIYEADYLFKWANDILQSKGSARSPLPVGVAMPFLADRKPMVAFC